MGTIDAQQRQRERLTEICPSKMSTSGEDNFLRRLSTNNPCVCECEMAIGRLVMIIKRNTNLDGFSFSLPELDGD